MLELVLALLDDQSEGKSVGISTDCITKSFRYPYFDGTSCVSCSVGTERARPYFYQDQNECVSACPENAPYLDWNRVCRQCPVKSPYWDAVSKDCMSC